MIQAHPNLVFEHWIRTQRVEDCVTVLASVSIIAAGVTSWPREGVALLILIAVLFAAVTIAVNRRGAAPTPVVPREEREAIAPPSNDPVAGMREPRDI